MSIHTSTIRGAELAWTESGSGPTVVWAHGLTSSGDGQERAGIFDWSPIVAEHRLIRYDARGHGRSTGTPTPRLYTWASLGLDLLGLLDEVADGQVDGLGSSMGTSTLLFAAVTDPDRFRRLVLTTPPTTGEVRAAHVRIYLHGAALVERSGLAAYEAASAAVQTPHVYSGLVEKYPASEVCEALLPSVLRGAALSDIPSDTELGALKQPALVLAWSGDPGHPLAAARHLTRVIPGAQMLVADTPAQLLGWPQIAADFLKA